MKAVSGFTGRQIASAFVANENGVFNYKKNAAARAIRGAIDAHGELSELLHGLANMLILSKRGFASTSIGSCIMAKWAFCQFAVMEGTQNRIRKFV